MCVWGLVRDTETERRGQKHAHTLTTDLVTSNKQGRVCAQCVHHTSKLHSDVPGTDDCTLLGLVMVVVVVVVVVSASKGQRHKHTKT